MKSKRNNVLFKRKLYKFIRESKTEFVFLIDIFLIIFLNIIHRDIDVMIRLLVFLSASILINKYYYKIVDTLFKNYTTLNNPDMRGQRLESEAFIFEGG